MYMHTMIQLIYLFLFIEEKEMGIAVFNIY